MTDTATGSTDTVKRTQKPRNVDYSLEVVDDLPIDESPVRHSPLEDSLASIVADEQYHGKFVRIAAYENGSAASASANVLRQRHGGTAAVEGFTIRPKRFQKDGKDLTGLFVKFDPNSIVPGAREEWDAKEKARKDAIAQKRIAEGKSPESTIAGNRASKATAQTGAQDAAAPQPTAQTQPDQAAGNGGAGSTTTAKAAGAGSTPKR